jgi:hypothetical protein
MFTDKVQGFYVENQGSEPMLFLHNSIKNYHFGRQVFAYINDGSLCEIYNTENAFYPFTERNIAIYREILKIQKQMKVILLKIENNRDEVFSDSSIDYTWNSYLSNQRDDFLLKIRNNNCIVSHNNIYHIIKELDTTNSKRKNDYIVEDEDGNRTTISMTKNHYLEGISINDYISYQNEKMEKSKKYFSMYSKVNALQSDIIYLSANFCSGEIPQGLERSEEGVSINIAKTFEPMLINDFFGEELISEELADIEEFKALLMSVLPNAGNGNYDRISVNNFLKILKGHKQNYFQVFDNGYYNNSIRHILNIESQRLTLGLTKDAKTFCSFDALCECIIHNKELFEMVSDFIETKK